ncbi:9-O-acetyl-N-acetylneuraminic acid deacetylase [Escherichia coli]|uniref:SASA family carbohydrate esterase n=1 Tax=Escherichia coli TaxID=562 RepID=UPI0010767E8C|nr:SASA family carbohydrate esterase [Escherichia coli]TFX97848.1 9-O-acetyl-N-acetylneuraminic acid deacetylase [Escherichia coli]
MAFKHYDVVRAASPSDLAERLTQKLKEGWQPFGSPVAITPYTLMQAIAAEGDVTTPVAVTGNEGKAVAVSATSDPEYYFVVVLAGQSNGMSYGEGLPLPETYDRPDPRIKQLARRSTMTPGGVACKYNDIIPADHCLHDVQDMSRLNHPKADLSKGQYGTVGQGLHIAKKLLPFIPANAGILLVPCCRGGSAFTTGADGTYSDASGASENSTRWGVDKPLYKDLIGRTKAALKKNPKNVLFAVVWMQGEFDFGGTPVNHAAQFGALVDKFRADLTDMAGQCVGGSAGGVPWICGDTTYFWKQKNESTYQTVYGSYKNKTEKNIHFVPFMTDENGVNVPTNKPEEDPDIPGIGYYGSKWRDSSATWTSQDRASHFSTWARRGIISDRLATAILVHAGRTAEFITGKQPDMVRPTVPSGEGPEREAEAPASKRTLMSLLASGEDLASQGWRYYHKPAGGDSVNKNIAEAVVSDAGATGGKALQLNKPENHIWFLEHDAAGQGAELLKKGGRVSVRFKLPGSLVPNQFALGIYWQLSSLPEGVMLSGEGNDMLMSFFLQTDTTNLNAMHHRKPNAKLDTFGVFDNGWHTLAFEFAGNNSIQVTPVLDEKRGAAFTLVKSLASGAVDKLQLTDISKSATYTLLIDSIAVEVNSTDTAA